MATPLGPQVLGKLLHACIRSTSLHRCSYSLMLQPSVHMVQTANMSRYSQAYMEPIIDKEELIKGVDETDPRRHRPIKAPSTDYSISPLFYDKDIMKFTNMMMKGGNKERVREIVRKLFENLKHMQVERYNKATSEKEKNEIECDPIVIFKQAVENCKPLLLTTRVVKGGIAYKVPVCARPQEQSFRAMKWIIESCRDKERRIPMEQKLAWEVMDAYNNQGRAVRKKQEVHRICESNRAYAHLR